MARKRIKLPTHLKRCLIEPFFSPCTIEAVFLKEYTDLFGNRYENIFFDDAGKIYTLNDIGKWM